MTDDELIAWLRHDETWGGHVPVLHEAADRIAELTAQRDEARADAEAKAHRVGELGALLDETLARAERAEAESRQLLDVNASWATWGSADDRERYAYRKPDQRLGRRWCPWCVDKVRATHYGAANGVVLMTGCQRHAEQWARAGVGAIDGSDQ